MKEEDIPEFDKYCLTGNIPDFVNTKIPDSTNNKPANIQETSTSRKS